MQVLFLGRAPRTKETLPDFLKWRRVTRPPLVFRGLTGSQRTPGFWGVTMLIHKLVKRRIYKLYGNYLDFALSSKVFNKFDSMFLVNIFLI